MKERKKMKVRLAARKVIGHECYMPGNSMVPILFEEGESTCLAGLWMSELYIAQKFGFDDLEAKWYAAYDFLSQRGFM